MPCVFPQDGAALLSFQCSATLREAGNFDQHPKNPLISPCREHRAQDFMCRQVPAASSCLWFQRIYIKSKVLVLVLNFLPVFDSSLDLTFQGHILSIAPSIWRRKAVEWEMGWSLSPVSLDWLSYGKQTINKWTPQKTRACLATGGRLLPNKILQEVNFVFGILCAFFLCLSLFSVTFRHQPGQCCPDLHVHVSFSPTFLCSLLFPHQPSFFRVSAP